MRNNSVEKYLQSFSYVLWLVSWVFVYLAYIGMREGLMFTIGLVLDWPMWLYILSLFAIMFLAKITAALMSLPIVAMYAVAKTPEMQGSRAKALMYFGIAYLTWGLVFMSVRDFYYMDKSDTKVLFMGICLIWGTWILLYRLNNMVTYVERYGSLKGYDFKTWRG